MISDDDDDDDDDDNDNDNDNDNNNDNDNDNDNNNDNDKKKYNIDIEIIVNYDILVSGVQFVAASLKMRMGESEKNYVIPYYNSYKSLQIGKHGYDNIDVVKLPCNIFLQNKGYYQNPI